MQKPTTRKNASGEDMQFVPTDPQGSYTGVPEESYEIPVQDADDL